MREGLTHHGASVALFFLLRFLSSLAFDGATRVRVREEILALEIYWTSGLMLMLAEKHRQVLVCVLALLPVHCKLQKVSAALSKPH